MHQVSDIDVYSTLDPDDLWIYDKLILSKKLGYKCGPAGFPVPESNWYVVRPITNLLMMSRGAYKAWLTPYESSIPDGYFWCEWFNGRHITIDYHWGKQNNTVEGYKQDVRLDRFTKWEKIDHPFELPACLKTISLKYEWLNIEMIDNHIIEVHLRYNDDFRNHQGDQIFPVWKDNPYEMKNATWYDSKCGDRLGFWVSETGSTNENNL